MADQATSFEHRGHTVQLTERFWFKISGPAVDDPGACESADTARAKINDAIKARETQERRKLSIPMLDEDGNPVTVTGVHGGHYGLLGVGKANALYPPKCEALLAERRRLNKRVKEIYRLIDPCAITTHGPHTVRTHEAAVQHFETRIAAAIAAAEKLP